MAAAPTIQRFRIILWSLVAVAAVAATVLSFVRPPAQPVGVTGSPFAMSTTAGGTFTRDDLKGTPSLVFFGYTFCPDVCPTTMADIAVALRGLDPALVDRLQVVFVTTDPAQDSPAVLGEYLARFDADLPKRFIGLTGDQPTIDQAQLATGVPLAEDNGKLHSSLLLLYGSDDEAHVAFDAGNTARDIAADLRRVTGTA
jgi:protein SCO1/2